MSNGWQIGREGRGQIILYRIIYKALAFPVKIVMMRDGRVTRFGDELGDGQPKRQVDGNSDGVLDDKRFEMVLARKFVRCSLK